ncbi:hypothetical protein OPV22_013203 [Ensete ventricosum]|uniref:Small auxin-up RNA n=1 Tax=Ensete ventricosum TaxID=4639 RepID=A0AAV8QUY3_ENSVE|nr:hypothetical protein OPV22_013203 [Ensete ventricosum]
MLSPPKPQWSKARVQCIDVHVDRLMMPLPLYFYCPTVHPSSLEQLATELEHSFGYNFACDLLIPCQTYLNSQPCTRLGLRDKTRKKNFIN